MHLLQVCCNTKANFLGIYGQLHEGLKKLNVYPQINFLPEDFEDFSNNGYPPSSQ
jgi:hypothetical protein